jgi:hypothetical protein
MARTEAGRGISRRPVFLVHGHLAAIPVTAVVVALMLAPLMFPPPVLFAPAAGLFFAQFVTPMIRLPAVEAVFLDRFVKSPLRAIHATLAVIICLGTGRASEQEKSTECGGHQHGLAENGLA